MTKVFLSYSEKDTETAKKIVSEFQRCGIRYYDFQEASRKGENFFLVSQYELLNADAYVVLVSKDFMKSFWGNEEAGLAFRIEKVRKNFIFTMKIKELDDLELGYLGNHTYLDCLKEGWDQSIHTLIGRLQEKEPNSALLPIPVAVYAMKSTELDGFKNDTRSGSDKFLAALIEDGVLDIFACSEDPKNNCYGNSRNHWRPLLGSYGTIEEIVGAMTQFRSHKTGRKMVPVFYSDDLFSDDKSRYAAKREFTAKSGILILDAISLFHHELRSRLQNSFGPHTAILLVHPLGMRKFQTCNLIIGKDGVLDIDICEEGLADLPDRFFEQYDAYCDLSVGDLSNIQRWLAQALPAVCENGVKSFPEQARLDNFRKQEKIETNFGNTLIVG